MIALQSETRAEFYLADMAVMSAGAISAALYTSLPYPDQVRTLQASEARIVFVENVTAMKALQNSGPLDVRWILLTGEDADVLTLEQLRSLGERRIIENPAVFERIRAEFD